MYTKKLKKSCFQGYVSSALYINGELGMFLRVYLRNYVIKIPVLLTLLLVLSGCDNSNQPAGHADSKPSPIKITEQPKSLGKMLITDFGEDFHQAWICFDDVGEPTSHTFYDKGSIKGFPNQYLGSEYSIRSNVVPFHYTWRALSRDSIKIESPPLGLQDHWSNVMFTDSTNNSSRLMKATSKARGQLYCSLRGHKQ